MDPVVHFELSAEDRERMVGFYSRVFGWEAQTLGEEMGHYTVVTTTATENGRPTKPGEINGGIYMRTEDVRSQAPSVVIAVQDIEATRAAIEQAGGKVTEPMEIPGVGRYASFHDTEGNRLSVLQPAPRG